MPNSTALRWSPRVCWCALITCAAIGAAPARAQVEVEPGVLDELASGHARVVVELRLASEFRPEGTLTENDALVQRQAIFAAQQAVLTALADADARLVRRPNTVPFLTLEVGPDGLAMLKTRPELIARVLEDGSAVANRPNDAGVAK
jgi:hypothetical protein